jgi:hypothetical protein
MFFVNPFLPPIFIKNQKPDVHEVIGISQIILLIGINREYDY